MVERTFTPKSFEDVDQADDPASHIRYLDAVSAEARFIERKRRTIELMRLPVGGAGLDVGCGTGEDVIAIARAVGPKGYAAGVDMSETMVAEGQKRAAAEGVAADFRRTDGATLPFDDGTFDAARIERVLIHAESPDAVIAEMVRVAKPGGRIVALETDFGSGMMDSPHRAIRRKLAAWIEDHSIRNGWMGRELWRRFREAGLTDVVSEPLTSAMIGDAPEYHKEQVRGFLKSAVESGALTTEEAGTYEAWLRETYDQGTFFMASTMFLATATVPA